MDKTKNYYDILDVPSFCEIKDIRKSYRRLALIYHPDRVAVPHKKKAEEKFKEIVEAHFVLSDPRKKKVYDDYLKSRSGTAGPQPDFTTAQKRTKRQSFTEAEVEEMLKRYFGENGYRSFKEKQKKDFSDSGYYYKHAPTVPRPWGLTPEGQGAAVVFCLFFYTMTLVNKGIRVPLVIDIVVPLGLLYILLESRLKKIKEPAVEAGPLWIIWLCYLITVYIVLSQALATLQPAGPASGGPH
ncbi:MAG: J domain-containing protein [Candidatus Omnitrophica bacterium]|nr:J domain-containing protein [Candidatus Omnitrophota bacterium]